LFSFCSTFWKELAVYVVIQEFDEGVDLKQLAVERLETAFAQVCCRAGVIYHFEQVADGWRLVLTDGERPECSPEPIATTYIKRADAHRDLMLQAVDGRLKGWLAVPLEIVRRQSKVATASLRSEQISRAVTAL
jgi:hypothetical protein